LRGGGLSGGEKKRLSLGVELLGRAPVLLLDEPTSGLDSNGSNALIANIRMITERLRLTVVCCLHQPSVSAFLTFDQVRAVARVLTHAGVVHRCLGRGVRWPHAVV
jgi:ABC-type multidrug transport system ATPase subunit